MENSPNIGHDKATQRRKSRFKLTEQRPPATTKWHYLLHNIKQHLIYLAVYFFAISEMLFITNINLEISTDNQLLEFNLFPNFFF